MKMSEYKKKKKEKKKDYVEDKLDGEVKKVFHKKNGGLIEKNE